MREFSAILMLALAEQTKIVVTKNKRGLIANAHMLTHFLKNSVFNSNLENYYCVVLKHSPWAIQF
jgi:hypothetical protein